MKTKKFTRQLLEEIAKAFHKYFIHDPDDPDIYNIVKRPVPLELNAIILKGLFEIRDREKTQKAVKQWNRENYYQYIPDYVINNLFEKHIPGIIDKEDTGIFEIWLYHTLHIIENEENGRIARFKSGMYKIILHNLDYIENIWLNITGEAKPLDDETKETIKKTIAAAASEALKTEPEHNPYFPEYLETPNLDDVL